MLSNSILLNFKPTISLSWLRLSTSTVIFFPFLFLIALLTNAWIFPSIAIWLSFIKISSLRLNLWLRPPPNFTPYFCTDLKLGAVFLVQQILQDLPFNLSTNFFVVVETPEIKLKKLRATLSLFKIALLFPYTIATTFPFLIFLPSFVFNLKIVFLS